MSRDEREKEKEREGERERVYCVGMTGYGVGMSRDESG